MTLIERWIDTPTGSPTCRSRTTRAATSRAPGTLDLDRYLRRIEDGGYAGYVALEYIPTGATVDSLGWLPRERRSLSLN